jgi:hypothetical protein
LIFEIISGTAEPLSRAAPGIPAELNDVVMTAMALSPNDRFANVERLAQAIRVFDERNAGQSVDFPGPTELRRSSIPDAPTPFKTEIETTIRTPWLFDRRSRVAIFASLAIALAIVAAAAFYALGSRNDALPSRGIQAAQPPRSPHTTQTARRPVPEAVTKSASRTKSETKNLEIENTLPLGMSAPKGERDYASGDDRTRERKSAVERPKKPVREDKPKRVFPREYVPVEKKPVPKPSTKPTDFEIDDDQIIDPFEN